MPDRYYIATPLSSERVWLTDNEAHHLLHVMRAKPGDEVIVFDGSGQEALARVTSLERSRVELEITTRQSVSRELPFELYMAVALPKGDRQRWLVEKCVELGVTRLIPLITERSIERESPGVGKRLSRYVVEASKQCGRNRLMTIDEPCKLSEYLGSQQDAARIMAHFDGQPLSRTLANAFVEAGLTASVALAIGPEGGFTAAEVALAKAEGWQIASLGPRVLRVETSALVLAAALIAQVS